MFLMVPLYNLDISTDKRPAAVSALFTILHRTQLERKDKNLCMCVHPHFMLLSRTAFSNSNCRWSTRSKKFFRSTYLNTYQHTQKRRERAHQFHIYHTHNEDSNMQTRKDRNYTVYIHTHRAGLLIKPGKMVVKCSCKIKG